MWMGFLIASVAAFFLIPTTIVLINKARGKKKFGLFKALPVGVYTAAILMFIPTHVDAWSLLTVVKTVALSIIKSAKVFAFGCDYEKLLIAIQNGAGELATWYQAWAIVLLLIAPAFAIGFVLSFFKNILAEIEYIHAYRKDVYIFSELNEKSLALATDIAGKNKNIAIAFTKVGENALIESANQLGAILFKKDICSIKFEKHSSSKAMFLFAIGLDENENLNNALKLIEKHKTRKNTHLYVFSTKVESEMLLTEVDKGEIKVRRINQVYALLNRFLYTEGVRLFSEARETEGDTKKISAVVLGMGNYGTEMTKALAWYGQMDGYSIEINSFDKDPLAEQKFVARAPELMSPKFNGTKIKGEAEYKITIHSGVEVDSATFAEQISKITDATYVFVALGDDDKNIATAVKLRMYFERMKIHPTIQAVVYNSQQKNALEGIKNYSGQSYDVEFVGDNKSSFTEDVIVGTELEGIALKTHLKWGGEESFWAYEYNYKSSTAAAIHKVARIFCEIPGAKKEFEELTPEEEAIIGPLEHRRWNAYMRGEGYIFSGATLEETRNNLGKMHHDLVEFDKLREDEKKKDLQVGTK